MLLCAVAATGLASCSVDLRVMSYNIRYAATETQDLEKPWSARLPLMAAQLNHETAGRPNSLLCFQEALYPQVQDLLAGLGSQWAYVGVGRNDGRREGEFSPIFYQPTHWTLLNSTTFWLSETPDVVGSVGWDAALPRIVTVASFRHRASGKPLVQMCTHFDHAGVVARKESAKLLVNIANRYLPVNKTAPAFIGGDLNSTPDSDAYQILSDLMNNVRSVVPEAKHHGNVKTSTSFDEDEGNDSEIDFLFINDNSGLEWVSFATLSNRFDDGIFISDHRPVVVDARIPS